MKAENDALEEYIAKKCEEIIATDERSSDYNKRILSLEKELKETMTPEQKKLYNRLEELIIEMSAHNEALIYRRTLYLQPQKC